MLIEPLLLEFVFPYLEPVLVAIKQKNLSPHQALWGEANVVSYCEIEKIEIQWSDDTYPDHIYTDRSLVITNIHDFENNEAMFPLLNWIPKEALISLYGPGDEYNHDVRAIQQFGPETGEWAKVSYQKIKAFLRFKHPESESWFPDLEEDEEDHLTEEEEALLPDSLEKHREDHYRHSSYHFGYNKGPECKSMDFAIERLHAIRDSMIPADVIAHKILCNNIIEHFALRIATSKIEAILQVFDTFNLNKEKILAIFHSNSQSDIYGRDDFRKIEPLIARMIGHKRGKDETKNLITFTQFYIKANGNSRATNDGRAFEELCRNTLVKDGWTVTLTNVSGDYGGDLVAERDELRWCIQCKDTDKPAGVLAIQQAVAGTAYYVCDYAVVVSRNGFTNQAVQLASRLKVTLCNENTISNIHLMV